ncbi:MAG: NADH-quinone oxidoreductase subunit M [Bdellovibrionales bacterium]|nr:NADH-quinone oxidoreductase subunit M [Bdellovibrionales bacterium]
MFLTTLIFFPLLMAGVLWFTPNEKILRPLALSFATVEFVLSLILFFKFDPSQSGLQLIEQYRWIPSVGVSYFVGLDGISFWLFMLTTFLTPLTILGSWTAIEKKIRGFLVAMLLLETTMLGTFVAMDAILFYTFFELSLVPMYFMIGIWGGQRRIYATLKFFIYTMVGSLFMLLGIIAMMFYAQDQLGVISASLVDFYKLKIPFVAGEILSTQTLLFLAFSLAFAIKVPLFPFHTWLPDAHVEAPTPGSVILAGVMLKMGTYGLLRFSIPMFPQASEYYSWIFLLIGVVGIIYGALVAMVQPDVKKLVAYSSVSHMGYIVLGLFSFNIYGVNGGVYQMLNHGISTGALFLLVGMIYERTHSREITKYGGLASAAPIFTIIFFIVTLSSIAVPMTNGFVGEFYILMGAFLGARPYAYFAVAGVVLGAAYMLWMFKRIFYGEKGTLVVEHEKHGLDLNSREILVMAPLVILIFWMGLFPGDFLRWSKASVDHVVANRTSYELSISDKESLRESVTRHLTNGLSK